MSLKVIENENLSLQSIASKTATNYTPKMDLPRRFQDKQLQYIKNPTHWILVNLASEAGKQPEMNFTLTIPAADFGGSFKIVGAKY